MDVIEVMYAILFLIFGLVIGSFLNVVIYRLPNEISLIKPNSHCPNCKNEIRWYDNVPLLSYLILGGKCRYCKTKISPRYFFVELFCGLMFVAIYLLTGLNPITFINIGFFCCLLSIFFIDLEHQIIADSLNITILILGIISVIIDLFNEFTSITILERFIGMFACGGAFFLISIIGKKVLKRDAMGDGDTKFVAACGFLVGWKLCLLGIFFGANIACLIELPLIYMKKKERETEIPFGPYLGLGIFIATLFGSQLLNWYFNLISF
jgi:leader peptidase (prepilin peptidase)/N-methyltransferase